MSLILRLKKYFSSILIIDKSVDLLLLFIGLFAAIQFDSYIKLKQTEELYKNSLTKIHTEISINKILLKDYANSIERSTAIIWELDSLGNQGFKETYNGILNINDIKVTQLNDRNFKALNENNFLNKNLYSDIKKIYYNYDKLEQGWDTLSVNLQKNYRAYFDIYASLQLAIYAAPDDKATEVVNNTIVDIANFYGFGSSVLKQDYWPNMYIRAASTLGDDLLEKIEAELGLYEVSLNEYRSYDDYYWLSYYSLENEDYTTSLEYALKGISILDKTYKDETKDDYEFKSFSGRLNRNVVFGINYLIENKDTKYKRNEILPFLKEWYDSGIYRESCIIEYLDFYYDNNDFSNFLKYTKLIFELESQKIYERYVPQWQDFMTKDSIISVLEKTDRSIEGWNSYIFPRSF